MGIRLLCHNVAGHWFSPNDPPNMLARLDAIVREAVECGADVVILQELYRFSVGVPLRTREFDLVVRALAVAGFELAASSETAWLGMDSGLCIFSKLPPISAQTHAFIDQATFPLIRPDKGYQVADLRWGSMVLRVVNTHLAWQGATGHAHLLTLQGAAAAAAADMDVCVCVCGDMNRPVASLDGYTSLTPAAPTHDNGGTYDHVFVRAPSGVIAQPARLANWHVSRGAKSGAARAGIGVPAVASDKAEAVSDHRGLIWELSGPQDVGA